MAGVFRLHEQWGRVWEAGLRLPFVVGSPDGATRHIRSSRE